MSQPSDAGRRRLLVALGSGAIAAVGAPISASILSPLRVQTVRGGEDFIDVGASEGILAGHPLRVTLRSDRHDAWTALRNVEIGSAWILKGEDGSVVAFSSVCPHLGCAVGFSQDRHRFECPCHDGVFARDGSRVAGPAPRGLDRLECRVEEGRILVRFARQA